MSKIMYRTNILEEIEKVEVDRETKNTVWVIVSGAIKMSQCRKRYGGCNFFDTFDEAKAFLVDKNKKVINELESSLIYQKQKLAKAMKLDENDC